MNIRQTFFNYLLPFLFLSVQPLISMAAISQPDRVIGKFSPGGMQLDITIIPKRIIFGLEIQYCDGTRKFFLAFGHIWEDHFTYFSDKPMQSVKIRSSTMDQSIDTFPEKITLVKRNCGDPPNVNLYCNQVEINQVIHRSQIEPISFRSNRYVYKAGLKLPAVDGLIWVHTVTYNYGLRSKQNLVFNPSDRSWSGFFPSMNIPIGNYSNVWLIVQDEFGQQAKCRIGNLEVQH